MSKTILAVDDSASIRQIVQCTLKGAGYDVVEAIDGQDGLDKASLRQADLVLTDQSMPHMDGITLIESLRRMSQYRATPIFVLTTESSAAMKARGKAAGATGWMVKPFDPRRLLEVVRQVIG